MIACIVAFATISIPKGPPILSIPEVADRITIDGRLNEPCYRRLAPLTSFLAAGNPGATIPATKAWLFWSSKNLTFAFEVVDPTLAGAKPSSNERDVDGQDRVEIFIWSGKPQDPYYCIEMASLGAIHDYKARFYRKFDDSWSPAGWKCRVTTTKDGYVVEGSLSRAAMASMGQKLRASQSFRLGLFRADFSKLRGDPTWITWVDRKGEPDFHVADSFGIGRLTPFVVK